MREWKTEADELKTAGIDVDEQKTARNRTEQQDNWKTEIKVLTTNCSLIGYEQGTGMLGKKGKKKC